MKQTLISYVVRRECSEENARLIQDVFKELKETAPPELQYLVLRAADGQFFHFVQAPDSAKPFTESEAFAAFLRNIKERFIVPVQRTEVTILGSYGMAKGDL